MKNLLCRTAGVLTALAGLLPAWLIFQKHLHWELREQADEAFGSFYLIRAFGCALIGFVIA